MLADYRGIGWQFQDGQLRFYVTVEDAHLQGRAERVEREVIAKSGTPNSPITPISKPTRTSSTGTTRSSSSPQP